MLHWDVFVLCGGVTGTLPYEERPLLVYAGGQTNEVQQPCTMYRLWRCREGGPAASFPLFSQGKAALEQHESGVCKWEGGTLWLEIRFMVLND